MSNIYLKVTTDKVTTSQNFDFLSLKNLSQDQICCNLKIRGQEAKLWKLRQFKVKESMLFVEQKYKL